MSRSQRDKGTRRERELVAKHLDLGVHAERVPLSGATRYQGSGHDVDVYVSGRDAGALVCEVKARKNGEGIVTLERWLGENDALFLWRDRQSPLVCLPWRTWQLLLGRLKP
jgi:Holliday junction resolvase